MVVQNYKKSFKKAVRAFRDALISGGIMSKGKAENKRNVTSQEVTRKKGFCK